MPRFKRKTDGVEVLAYLLEVPATVCPGMEKREVEYIPGDWLMVAPGRFPNSLYFVKNELFRRSCEPVDAEAQEALDHRVPLVVDETRPLLEPLQMVVGREYLVVCKRTAEILPPEAARGVFMQRTSQFTLIVDGDRQLDIPTDRIAYAIPVEPEVPDADSD